jgi:hypothetical protein
LKKKKKKTYASYFEKKFISIFKENFNEKTNTKATHKLYKIISLTNYNNQLLAEWLSGPFRATSHKQQKLNYETFHEM